MPSSIMDIQAHRTQTSAPSHRGSHSTDQLDCRSCFYIFREQHRTSFHRPCPRPRALTRAANVCRSVYIAHTRIASDVWGLRAVRQQKADLFDVSVDQGPISKVRAIASLGLRPALNHVKVVKAEIRAFRHCSGAISVSCVYLSSCSRDLSGSTLMRLL